MYLIVGLEDDGTMKNKKGFTLAELLIVVAIIGVLVAVSIPIFTSQLEKSKEATDIANLRAAKAAAVAAYYDIEAAGRPDKSIDGLEPVQKGKWYEGYYDISKGQFVGRNGLSLHNSVGKGTAVDTGTTYSNYTSSEDYTKYCIFVEIMFDGSSNPLPYSLAYPGAIIHWRNPWSGNSYKESMSYDYISLK